MIIGTNWMLGWSHKTASLDQMITSRYNTSDSFLPMFEAYLEYGIDAIMGPISDMPDLVGALKSVEDKLGRKLIFVDTPLINVDDNKAGRDEANAVIRKCRETGAEFCLIHHSSLELIVNKQKGVIDRLSDYTSMIRDAGMIPGLSAHIPEVVLFSDRNGYDVETYIQPYNCLGFLLHTEIENISYIINNASKPVMIIKALAAGRCTPYVGLNFVWSTIRERDMVTVGAHTPEEVHENVEISLAAFDHRFPDIQRRASINNNQAVLSKYYKKT